MRQDDPRLEGYTFWSGHDPFEDYVGPLYYKDAGDGTNTCAFIIEQKHINGQGGLHGGMLMTFADYALFLIARNHLKDVRAVTVTFNAEFTAPAGVGDFVEATGEVVHETRGMLFLRGTIASDDAVLLNFSGVLKKLGPRKERPATQTP